ncbi:uncharacterized protein [Glycine max]|uniref:uncharacterized protein isoform X2 n=1 Tax=Glycine max TaxID=3847 RepID=UPI001B355C6F|nr:uncharacterized protein LOC121173408 isoform X2 [Glycine max]
MTLILHQDHQFQKRICYQLEVHITGKIGILIYLLVVLNLVFLTAVAAWKIRLLLLTHSLEAKGRFQSEKAIPTELYCTAAEGQPLLTPLPAAFCCCSLFLIITGCLHLVCCCFFFGVGLLCAELLHLGLIHNTRLGGEQEILRLEVSMHHTHEMADVNHIHNLSDDCGGFRLRVVPSPLHSSMTRLVTPNLPLPSSSFISYICFILM